MPPGSGVPVPGANAGSSTSTSTVRKTGPPPTISTARSTTAAIPRSRTSCMKNEVMPCSACQRELGLAGPVAAQADLHVARRVDDARLARAGTSACRARPRRRRPACRCRCACRSGRGRRGRAASRTRGCPARRSSGRRRARSGCTPAATTSPTVASIAACERAGIGRQHRRRRRSRRCAARRTRRPSPRDAGRAGSSQRGSRAGRSARRGDPRRDRRSAHRRSRRRSRQAARRPACSGAPP